jgi:hypothetical protein
MALTPCLSCGRITTGSRCPPCRRAEPVGGSSETASETVARSRPRPRLCRQRRPGKPRKQHRNPRVLTEACRLLRDERVAPTAIYSGSAGASYGPIGPFCVQFVERRLCGVRQSAVRRERAGELGEDLTPPRTSSRSARGVMPASKPTSAAPPRSVSQRLATRGTREYGVSIEIVLLIAALAIAVFVALALPPRARRNGDASEAETRDAALSDDRGGRFKRWRRLR